MSEHLSAERLKELRVKLQRRQDSGVTGYQAWIDVPHMLSLIARIDAQAATIQRVKMIPKSGYEDQWSKGWNGAIDRVRESLDGGQE